MQKAFKWLDRHKVKYTFHNYREDGLTRDMIIEWLKKIPVTELVNARSTTFKELGAAGQAALKDKEKTIKMIMENESVVKRPLVEVNGNYMLGFKEKEWEKVEW